MYGFVVFIHIIVCVGLILVVLFQAGKGAVDARVLAVQLHRLVEVAAGGVEVVLELSQLGGGETDVQLALGQLQRPGDIGGRRVREEVKDTLEERRAHVLTRLADLDLWPHGLE